MAGILATSQEAVTLCVRCRHCRTMRGGYGWVGHGYYYETEFVCRRMTKERYVHAVTGEEYAGAVVSCNSNHGDCKDFDPISSDWRVRRDMIETLRILYEKANGHMPKFSDDHHLDWADVLARYEPFVKECSKFLDQAAAVRKQFNDLGIASGQR